MRKRKKKKQTVNFTSAIQVYNNIVFMWKLRISSSPQFSSILFNPCAIYDPCFSFPFVSFLFSWFMFLKWILNCSVNWIFLSRKMNNNNIYIGLYYILNTHYYYFLNTNYYDANAISIQKKNNRKREIILKCIQINLEIII